MTHPGLVMQQPRTTRRTVDAPPGAFRARWGWSTLDVLTGAAITGEEQARGPWGAWLAFGIAYLALALSADWLTNQASEFSTFWPAAGLYVGVLLLVERRAWPGFVAVAAVAGVDRLGDHRPAGRPSRRRARSPTPSRRSSPPS